jgi:hypothetical protein
VGQLLVSDRLTRFRRVYRWASLTLVHQGVWPLLLLLTSAPAGKPGELPFAWALARTAAPVVAALCALVYLRALPSNQPPPVESPRVPGSPPSLATQARVGLVTLTVTLAAGRLVAGPFQPAAQLLLFGTADVLAFQLIHFGVVQRSYRDSAQGVGTAVLLFGLSWGVRDLLLTALGPVEASPVFALLTGALLGAAIATMSRMLRRWPGGPWAAAAVHLLIVYLIVGYLPPR